VRRNDSREVIGHEVLELKRLVSWRRTQPLRCHGDAIMLLKLLLLVRLLNLVLLVRLHHSVGKLII
jgi:hypothetical protein